MHENLQQSQHKIAAKQFPSSNKIQIIIPNPNEIESIPMEIIPPKSQQSNVSMNKLLSPEEIDPSVHKSHSEGSLGKLSNKNHLPVTKITNNANLTDPCVPCPPVCLRPAQLEIEPATSPVHGASGLPGSVGTKVTNSPAGKIPLHRRSSDSDLSITPKGKIPLYVIQF